MTVTLEALPKGHQFPPTTFDLSPEWVAEYVASVEDEAISALGALVPPMAVAALSIRALLEGASLPAGAVHLAQELAFLRAVRIGERLSARAQITSRGERQGWVLMGVEHTVEDEARVAVMTGRATITFPTLTSAAVPAETTAAGDRLVVASGLPRTVVKKLTQDKINRYANSSGDHNPLHTDLDFAETTRFGGTIAHGLLVLASISELMTAAYGRAWLAAGRLKIRFRRPARPGDTVTASGRVVRNDGGITVCEVECCNQNGEILITGEAGVRA